jgi:hypothetical protein
VGGEPRGGAAGGAAPAARLDLTDVLVTTDSLHSHERLARKIRARGGHRLFVIKGNQPTVHANLTRLPWDRSPDLVTTTEKAHGRVEVRSLKALTVTTPGLVGFWGTKQVIELRRRTRRKKTVTSRPAVSEEVFYLVTSLPAEQAHPRHLAARGHWTIEASVARWSWLGRTMTIPRPVALVLVTKREDRRPERRAHDQREPDQRGPGPAAQREDVTMGVDGAAQCVIVAGEAEGESTKLDDAGVARGWLGCRGEDECRVAADSWPAGEAGDGAFHSCRFVGTVG